MFSGKKGGKKGSSSTSNLPPHFDFFTMNNNEGGNNELFNDPDLEAELQSILDDDDEGASSTKTRATTRTTTTRTRPDASFDVDAFKMAVSETVNRKDDGDDDDEDVDEDDETLLNELSLLAHDGQTDDGQEERQTSRVPRQSAQVGQHPPSRPTVGAERNTESKPLSDAVDVAEEAGQSLLKVINGRIDVYNKAYANAMEANDKLRGRRYKRGLDKLQELRGKLNNNEAVDSDEIPPNIVLQPNNAQSEVKNDTTTTASRSDNSNSVLYIQHSTLTSLQDRRQEIKTVALNARVEGDKALVMEALKAIRQCEVLMEQLKSGEIQVNDVQLPPIPKLSVEKEVQQEQLEVGKKANEQAPRPQQPKEEEQPQGQVQRQALQQQSFTLNYSDPQSIQQGLVERLNKFRSDSESMKASNPSKSRRYSRICKQYEDALKMHVAGKKVDLASLPQPLGFPPLVANNNFSEVSDFVYGNNEDGNSNADMSNPAETTTANNAATTTKATTDAASVTETLKAVKPASSTTNSAASVATTSKPGSVLTGSNARKRPQTLHEKQLNELLERQRLFKEAALASKHSNRIDEAKDYLRQSKGIDKLIQAVQAGLPIDMTTLPIPPQRVKDDIAMDFEIVSQEDCSAPSPSLSDMDRRSVYVKLETDLIAQIKMCESNIKHFKSTGDVARSNRFQQMCEHAKSDLAALRNAFKRGEPVPKFYYELRAFPKEVCNTDLSDNDLEIAVVQGVNFSLSGGSSDGIDTYLKVEFPYPKETPFRDRSAVVRSSTLAKIEYKYGTLVSVRPKDKGYQRIFKRQNLRVEVWRKVGFLRSDTLLGTVLVKLQPLETNCIIHDAFPLMDGRRTVGGKLEVRIRTRHPVLTKQVTRVQERWLVVEFK